MSLLMEADPIVYVLAFLLAVVWLLLWLASRRARFWYAGLAPILAVLCWPLAIVAEPYGSKSVCQFHQQACVGDATLLIMINGILALPVALLLGLLTLLLEAGRALWRRRRSSSP